MKLFSHYIIRMKRVNIQWNLNDQIALIWLFFTDSKIGQNNKARNRFSEKDIWYSYTWPSSIKVSRYICYRIKDFNFKRRDIQWLRHTSSFISIQYVCIPRFLRASLQHFNILSEEMEHPDIGPTPLVSRHFMELFGSAWHIMI